MPLRNGRGRKPKRKKRRNNHQCEPALAGRFFYLYFFSVYSSFQRPAGLFVLLTLFVPLLSAGEGPDIFWRYGMDRYNQPTLTDPLEVPDGADPYEYLAAHHGYGGWTVRRSGDVVFLAEKSAAGVVPVLCLHKLSREDDYALTPERFRSLLRYIRNDGWYMVSDRQYIEGDFSRVPAGLKPIVMGSDDASYGNFIYQTRGDRLTGPVKRVLGKPLTDRDSMVAILEKLAEPEEGRINFTFYVSFDAVPFRQLDGFENPGFPYRGVPVIAEKIRYLDEKFILGIHSLSHLYAHEMGPEQFAQDVEAAWEILDEYAGGTASSLHTMAFPFGIRPLTPEMRRAVTSLSRNGRYLSGAFDFDNKLAPAPGSLDDNFDVSRFNVDNRNWDRLMSTLKNADALHARRQIVWEVDTKKLPASRYSVGASRTDEVWVLVRGGDSQRVN
jgi:hypothetical protein